MRGAIRGVTRSTLMTPVVGVTVRVSRADTTVIDTLTALDPIRLDIVTADGTPTGEALFEADDHALTILGDRLLHQTDPDWDDPEEQQRRV